jgi:hypothetical protein
MFMENFVIVRKVFLVWVFRVRVAGEARRAGPRMSVAAEEY